MSKLKTTNKLFKYNNNDNSCFYNIFLILKRQNDESDVWY